ncbi:MAG: hypothetical protein FWF63_00385 [Fibromonadales bacterium]|nr:hypothetical protein [Fibromonadales bacterium]
MIRIIKLKLADLLNQIGYWSQQIFPKWIGKVIIWLLKDEPKKFCGGIKIIRPKNPAAILRKIAAITEESRFVLALTFNFGTPEEKIKVSESDPYERIVAQLKQEGLFIFHLEVANV